MKFDEYIKREPLLEKARALQGDLFAGPLMAVAIKNAPCIKVGTGCKFCDAEIYIKIRQYAKSAAAPLTIAAALTDKLQDITGESYVSFPALYCPMCGKRKEDP